MKARITCLIIGVIFLLIATIHILSLTQTPNGEINNGKLSESWGYFKNGGYIYIISELGSSIKGLGFGNVKITNSFTTKVKNPKIGKNYESERSAILIKRSSSFYIAPGEESDPFRTVTRYKLPSFPSNQDTNIRLYLDYNYDVPVARGEHWEKQFNQRKDTLTFNLSGAAPFYSKVSLSLYNLYDYQNENSKSRMIVYLIYFCFVGLLLIYWVFHLKWNKDPGVTLFLIMFFVMFSFAITLPIAAFI